MKTLQAVALATGILVAGSTQAADYWSTSGAKIVDSSGNTVHITGANWFGFETSNLMPHGLWSVNYRQFLDKVKSMGITVIRLPYSDDIMSNPKVQSLNDYVNPELAGFTTMQLMDAIVDYCGQLGIRIILDRHRPDSGGQSKLWYTAGVSEATWIKNMQTLAARYKGNSTVIGFDLHNEPHADGTMPSATGACWGCGDTTRDWRLAAERGGNAVLEANPDLLIVVEGVSCPSGGNPNAWDDLPDEQCGWWGGNLTQAKQFPVRLSKPNKLVYSAHDYGMSVYGQQSWFLDPAFPATLEPFWDGMFGYLVKENIAPVLLGEFGSTLQDPKDKVWLTNLLTYAKSYGLSWTYWCLNPNSGDTKGLFLDDWTTVDSVRYDVIKPFLAPLTGGGGPGPTTYTVTVAKAGTGSGTVTGTGAISCGTTCTASYASGTSVTLTATPAAGSSFAGWSGACAGTSTCVLGMTAARSVTATFTLPSTGRTLTVTRSGTGSGTVTSSAGGLNCGATCTAAVASGTTITLTATAAAGSTFDGWSGACTGTTCVVTLTADLSVGAAFRLDTTTTSYTLTVTRSGAGAGTVTSSVGGVSCGATCTASLAAGTAVTLTATPASGSTFGGWSGACTNATGTCVVTMTGAQSVGAAFGTTSTGTAPCSNPVTFTNQSGNFNTTGAVCYRTSQTVNGWGCSNFAGRTVSVNGGTATTTCGPGALAKHSDGYTYFSVSAGTYSWASLYTW